MVPSAYGLDADAAGRADQGQVSVHVFKTRDSYTSLDSSSMLHPYLAEYVATRKVILIDPTADLLETQR